MFNSIPESIESIQKGEMVIVLDDEDRENEGDFIMAAEKITPEAVNFMLTVGRGLICAPLTEKRARELSLPMMIQDQNNETPLKTAFTVSVDIDNGNTGISTTDRAETLQKLAEPQSSPGEFVRPGHIFPLIAKDGGVLERDGHTEAALDLCRLANLREVGVICEILNPDGTMARTPELMELAKKYGMKIMTIKELINYRNGEDYSSQTERAL